MNIRSLHSTPGTRPQQARLIWIGLGSNLPRGSDSSLEVITAAVHALHASSILSELACAGLYRSSPIDAQGPDYINTVVRARTMVEAKQLLQRLQIMEQEFGRQRPFKHAPRTLDLDLLHVEGEQRSTPDLTLPHPRLTQRAFVVKPLHELNPDFSLPKLGHVQQWLQATQDQIVIRIADSPI